MNEDEFGRKLAGALTASTRDLDPAIRARLRVARQRALAPSSLAARPLQVATFAWRVAAVVAAVSILAFIGDRGGVEPRADDQDSVDAALLTDDLPIDAYLDTDFKTWLEQEQEPQS